MPLTLNRNGNTTVLKADASGLYRFAQLQSRHAITSRIGYENLYQGDSSYYNLNNGGEAEIVYDAAAERDDGRGSLRGEYTDDEERVGRHAAEDVGKKHRWDEDGCYKNAREVDRSLPEPNASITRTSGQKSTGMTISV